MLLDVEDTIAIGELNVLAESAAVGAAAMLPDAVSELGDSLAAIFYFDDVGKEWSFYDPRPEFSDLNTLSEMVSGEAYWILVSETVEDVVLNNKVPQSHLPWRRLLEPGGLVGRRPRRGATVNRLNVIARSAATRQSRQPDWIAAEQPP